MSSLREGARQGVLVAVIGLLVGAVAAWAGVALGDPAVGGLAHVEGAYFRWLTLLLPVALLLTTGQALTTARRRRYVPATRALEVLVPGALIGAWAGAVLFFIAAASLPAALTAADPAALGPALRAEVGWEGVAWLTAVTLIWAVGLALAATWYAAYAARARL